MQNTLPFETGIQQRDEILAAHEEKSKDFVTQCRIRLLQVMLAGNGLASMDDVRAVLMPPEGTHPTVFGAVPPALAKAEIIERAGHIRSTNQRSHCRPLQQWRLINPNKAREWIAAQN